MALRKAVFVAIAAMVAVLLFCGFSLDADESDAMPVAGFMPAPPPEAAPAPENHEDSDNHEAELPPAHFHAKVVPVEVPLIDVVPVEPDDFEDGVVPEIPDDAPPMPFVPIAPQHEIKEKVIRLTYESLLNLSILQKSLSIINNGKEDDAEDSDDTEIIIVEEVDEGNQTIPPMIDIDICESYLCPVSSIPILFAVGEAVGPIFCF